MMFADHDYLDTDDILIDDDLPEDVDMLDFDDVDLTVASMSTDSDETLVTPETLSFVDEVDSEDDDFEE